MKTALFNGYKVNLVENMTDIEVLKRNLNPRLKVGIDTETTGLSYKDDKIVGVCISTGQTYSKDNYQGYYLPIRHVVGNNLPVPVVMAIVQDLLDNYVTCFFNRNFDVSFLENEGVVIPFIGRMHDIQCLAHLVDNESYPALKAYCENYLKFKVIEFNENNTKNHNFGTTDPNVSFVYAAGDPLMTVLLGNKLWNEYPYIRKVYPIDNKATEAVRLLGKVDVIIDYDIIRREYERESRHLQEIKNKIYSFVGYHFNLNSTRDKAEALNRYVTLTAKTRSGKFKVDKEVLARIDHPLAVMLREYSGVEKYVGTYLKKLLTFEGQPVRINYSAVNVATGRLSSGGAKGNNYYQNLNIQNIPKVEVFKYVHEDPELGYILNDEEEGSIKKMKCKGGLREAFTAPEGYVILSADFASQEMALMANFSQEPNLINPLLEGKDIHNYIAKQMFGFEDPAHRTKVKVLNFAVNYGAGAYTISRRLGISVDEAEQLLSRYNATLSKLTAWKKEMILQGKKRGMIFTYFGRPRLVYKYFNSSDPGMRGFAERTCMNSGIQGCLPTRALIELEDRVVTMQSTLAQRLRTYDGKVVVPSHRGKSALLCVQFWTGDFVVCDSNHKFVGFGDGQEKVRVDTPELFDKCIVLAPLHKKRLPKKLFSHKSSLNYIKLMLRNSKEIKNDDMYICAALWKLAVTRRNFDIDDMVLAASFRSLASIYGFNLIHLPNKKFSVRFTRAKVTKAASLFFTGQEEEVGSCTVVNSSEHYYPTQGVYNFNTGGDLIRIVLCKFYQEQRNDPEFAENCILFNTVHDEINVYVKPKYLYKLYNKVKDIMTFQPKSFAVPIYPTIGVGNSWGAILDCKEITPDNKIVL